MRSLLFIFLGGYQNRLSTIYDNIYIIYIDLYIDLI